MYVSNIQEYGHLLNADNYDTSHLHNDMYQLFDNRMVSLFGRLVVGHHSNIIPLRTGSISTSTQTGPSCSMKTGKWKCHVLMCIGTLS